MYYICTVFKKAFLIAAFVLSLTLVSCESDKALSIVNQEKAIDTYITSKYPNNEVVRNGGSNRIIISRDSSRMMPKIAKGDSAYIYYRGYVFTNSPSTLFAEDSAFVKVGSGKLIPGLDNGLVDAELGEESLILFSAKYGYYDQSVGLVPSMSALMFDVFVSMIKKNN